MDYQPIALQGKDIQGILSDTAKLAMEILAVREYLDYLEESQRRLYPDQAPAPGRTRRNKPRPSTRTFSSAESHVLYVVIVFTEKHKRPPTLREIRQRIRRVDPSQTVKSMVQSGLLKEVTEEGRKTTWYASTGLTFELKKEQQQQDWEDELRKERENQERQGHESMPLVLEVVRQLIESKGDPLVRPSEVRKLISHLPYWGDALNLLKAAGQLLAVDEYGKGTWYTLP